MYKNIASATVGLGLIFRKVAELSYKYLAYYQIKWFKIPDLL